MNLEKIVYLLEFNKEMEDEILSFDYFLLNKNIEDLEDLKKILNKYSFLDQSDLKHIIDMYNNFWINFDLEITFLEILNSILYRKKINNEKLKRLWKHIWKFNNILDIINNKIKKRELKAREINEDYTFCIDDKLKYI